MKSYQIHEITDSQIMYNHRPIMLMFTLMGSVLISVLLLGSLSIYASSSSVFTSSGELISLNKTEIVASESGIVTPSLSPLENRVERKQKLAAIQTESGSVDILSPADGLFFQEPSLMKGKFLSPGDPIGVITSNKEMVIKTEVSKKDMMHVKDGKTVIVRLSEIQTEVEGVISSIQYVHNEEQGNVYSVLIEFTTPPESQKFREGMEALVVFETAPQ
ncbi:HlyD family secretion protein [Rossellomorea marisflavi]|uniref:HlyD family secretion protein n=1 Tax=Rossellomorea marisflavi TaxID=189381 RepID=UPI0027A4DF1F|nr:HlyD family secretion protein [Rossellomorea marisflavi]UTE73449.1 HlyD family secretion protein [Rossellomorea marisflavi]